MPDPILSEHGVRGSMRFLPLVVPLLAAALAQYPIVHRFFMIDDFIHLYEVANLPTLEFLLKPLGGHLYLTRNAAYVLFHPFLGIDPMLNFGAIFLTHLLNVGLLYQTVRSFTGRLGVAVAVATLWGISPIHFGTLGLYTQYGHVLAATSLLLVLYSIGRMAEGGGSPSRAALASWAGLLMVAATSFGVAIPIAASFGVVVSLLLPGFVGLRRVWFGGFLLALIPAFYFFQHWLYARVTPEPTLAFELQLGVTLSQLWEALPLGIGLVSYAVTSLFLAPIFRPAFIVQVYFGVFIGFVVAWVWALARAGPVARRRLIAFSLIAVAGYAAIAIGRSFMMVYLGQSIEWKSLQPRYHYVGLMSISLVFSSMFAQLAEAGAFRGAARRALVSIGLMSLIVFAVREGRTRPDPSANARFEFDHIVTRMREHIRRHRPGADVYIPNGRFESVGYALGNPIEFPGWAAVFIIAFPENTVHGSRVYFVEKTSNVVEALTLRSDTRIAHVLVAPDRFPGKFR